MFASWAPRLGGALAGAESSAVHDPAVGVERRVGGANTRGVVGRVDQAGLRKQHREVRQTGVRAVRQRTHVQVGDLVETVARVPSMNIEDDSCSCRDRWRMPVAVPAQRIVESREASRIDILALQLPCIFRR